MSYSLLERILFGKEGLDRAIRAEKRLSAAHSDRQRLDLDFDEEREKLNRLVSKSKAEAQQLESSAPTPLTIRPPSSADLSDDDEKEELE